MPDQGLDGLFAVPGNRIETNQIPEAFLDRLVIRQHRHEQRTLKTNLWIRVPVERQTKVLDQPLVRLGRIELEQHLRIQVARLSRKERQRGNAQDGRHPGHDEAPARDLFPPLLVELPDIVLVGRRLPLCEYSLFRIRTISGGRDDQNVESGPANPAQEEHLNSPTKTL